MKGHPGEIFCTFILSQCQKRRPQVFFKAISETLLKVREVRAKMPRMYLRKNILNPCEKPPWGNF